MSKIKFTREVEFRNDGGFYDDHPQINQFYEESYLTINPNLHEEDSLEKIATAEKAIHHLISKQGLRPIRIMDIGSGSTLVLKGVIEFIESLGFSGVTGFAVDISSSILKASPSYKNIYKLRADASNLPFENQSFSLLLMIDLLEHTLNPHDVIDEALRVASHVIIKTPLELSLYTLFRGGRRRLRDMKKRYGHIQHFNYKQIKNLTGRYKILSEKYVKIPNRSRLFDLLQDFLIEHRFYGTFRKLFGGFIVISLSNKTYP